LNAESLIVGEGVGAKWVSGVYTGIFQGGGGMFGIFFKILAN